MKAVLSVAAILCVVLSASAHASDLILLSGISAYSADGEAVALRETGAGGCVYAGSFHNQPHPASSWVEKVLAGSGTRLTSWLIEVTEKRCGGLGSQPVSMTIPLDSAHTYFDDLGRPQPGYAPGDAVASTRPRQVAH
ncbi:hypothetical protein [Burkholderia gladioli]|uniref:hypothetical protein n=1 Tax=Burkholderia gladioli TaxID=28095 RepID=UPI00163FDBA1|nr:hypothetical protein [Burkholderia gladioli]